MVENAKQFSGSAHRMVDSNKSELIDRAEVQDGAGPVPPTPPPKGNVMIVFTDIVDSTAIWEENVEAMISAMEIHDNIVRDLTCVHNGYEVKTNGDGFMIAFQSAVSALQFCLDVQQQLIDQEWPDEILNLQAGKESSDTGGHVLFKGLRIRMSVHSGTPVCVWNKVVNRLDYLGPMVNRAARFIEITEGGQIVVSKDFLLEIQEAARASAAGPAQPRKEDEKSILDLDVLRSCAAQKTVIKQPFEIRLLGEHQFKGLPEEQKLYFIVPESLHGRLDLWPKHEYIAGSKGNIVRGT